MPALLTNDELVAKDVMRGAGFAFAYAHVPESTNARRTSGSRWWIYEPSESTGTAEQRTKVRAALIKLTSKPYSYNVGFSYTSERMMERSSSLIRNRTFDLIEGPTNATETD